VQCENAVIVIAVAKISVVIAIVKSMIQNVVNSRFAVLKLVVTKDNFGHFRSMEHHVDGCV